LCEATVRRMGCPLLGTYIRLTISDTTDSKVHTRSSDKDPFFSLHEPHYYDHNSATVPSLMMFSLPLPAYQQPGQSQGKNSSSRKRKRKGSSVQQQQQQQQQQRSHNQVTDSSARSLGSTSPSQKGAFSAVLTPDEIYQYVIAGQPVEDELHGHAFPHANSGNNDQPSKFDYELRQQLKPGRSSTSGMENFLVIRSMHQQHLAVITTILHRSILEQDFMRAGRALGMILRDEMGGKPVDIRSEGRWGIGAEILIRQDAQRQQRSPEGSSMSSAEQISTPRKPRAWFTRKGFEDAKKYYERLVVQHPFHTQNPAAVSALDFYPAMFGLWIYVVHQEAKLKTLESTLAETESDSDDELQSEAGSPATRKSSRLQPIHEELSQAREIADRLDSVMTALPYRDDTSLGELREMLQHWIADLEEALKKPSGKSGSTNQREDPLMESLTSEVNDVFLHGQT
jgi:RNA polymerase I specific initiation factor